MIKISLDSPNVRECVAEHNKAYAVLASVLEDLANGNEVKTIGRGGREVILSAKNGRNTASKRYYARIYELSGDGGFPCLAPEAIHEVVSTVRKHELAEKDKHGLKRAKQVVAKLYSYDRFSRNMSPKYADGVLSWCANETGWGAWQFIKALDIRSCVYCNAETIFSLLLTNKLPGTQKDLSFDCGIQKRSALDHFYGYSQWPFLGITLSNLIPACTRCNTNVKGAKELNWRKHIYPYSWSFHDGAKFSVALRSTKDKMRMDETDLHIAIVPNDDEETASRSMGSAAFFHLTEVYNQLHKRDALAVLQRITALPQTYREFLTRRYPGIKEMVLDYVCRGTSLNSTDILSHNLSKLTIDIEEQFG